MFALRQFINWKSVPDPTGKKPRKIPFDPVTNEAIDPHDSKYWRTFEEARLTGHPVGFVLTTNDPYFLFDLDDCRDPLTGQWSQGATQIAALFPGAAMEVSINGTGMHIVGRCAPILLGPKKRKFNLYGVDCEFYTSLRFMALGHGFGVGDLEIDWTSKLASLVPVREEIEDVELGSEAVPEYTGPEDDEELIALMLKAHGSANQLFGNTATLRDLWTCNVEALAKVFPSPANDSFDRSKADGALMSHLAFYTGKNAERMDRLFRRSGLMREKYEKRASYRQATISGSIAKCSKVYDRPRKQSTGQTDAATINEMEYMRVEEQRKHFAGCFYIMRDHVVMVPGGHLLNEARFKVVYGGYQFMMSMDNTRPTFNAFEAFTMNRAIRFPKVQRTRFKPDRPHGEIIGDGVNMYMPEDIPASDGDVTPFLDLLRKLLPNDRDREILVSWMAALIQYKGKKFLWSPVLQGTKGNGKSLVAAVLSYCIGERYSWTPKAKKIDAQFNKFLANRIFISVEEIHMFARMELLEALKDLITGTKQEVELKGVDAYMDSDYCANWFFCTNHKDAIIKERDDRRFAILFTAQQSREDMRRDGMLDRDYFPKLWDWLRDGGGYEAVHGFLKSYKIADEFNPATKCFMAPETSSTQEAIETSLNVTEQYLVEAVAQEKQGFRRGWISTWAANKWLLENNVRVHPKRLGESLKALGYVQHGRATVPIMMEENNRPMLWKLPDADCPDYDVAQGYVTSRPSSVSSLASGDKLAVIPKPKLG